MNLMKPEQWSLIALDMCCVIISVPSNKEENVFV